MLASEPHIAGTPGGARGAERLAALFRGFGLEVETPSYDVLLAPHISGSVSIASPERVDLPDREPAIPGDPFSAHPDLAGGFSAYSASGDVTAEVVYANTGTKDDFARLKSLGIDLAGKVVIARMGGNFRGYKEKFAREAGAAALIIYPDPRDMGYAQGLPYPEGGYYTPESIHRGSLPTLPYAGDPQTPGIASTPDLPDEKRLRVSEIDLPGIPVQPISWASAEKILLRMRGVVAPREWQGALPFTYRMTGGDALTVRVRVESKRERRMITDVIARLPGASHPEQTVIVGAHHDAWNFGADDPLSGTIVVVEAARAFAEAARSGLRPARTVVFAGWDAEEWGIIGSTEWVEEHAADLAGNCLAYINLDAAVAGHTFDASCSPSLRPAVIWATRFVPQPPAPPRPWEARAPRDPGQMMPAAVFAVWPGARPGDGPARTLGGGSDHVAFLSHLAIPCAAPGFSGAPGTQWHTNYDNLAWYRKMMGDDYQPHAALTKIVALTMAAVADADLPPVDPSMAASDARAMLDSATRRAAALGFAFSAEPFIAPFDEMLASARRAAAALAAWKPAPGDTPAIARVARALRDADGAWFLAEGLPGRPWHRNLFVGPDEDSGYAPWPLPLLRLGIERRDPALVEEAARRYREVATKAAAATDEARRAVEP